MNILSSDIDYAWKWGEPEAAITLPDNIPLQFCRKTATEVDCM